MNQFCSVYEAYLDALSAEKFAPLYGMLNANYRLSLKLMRTVGDEVGMEYDVLQRHALAHGLSAEPPYMIDTTALNQLNLELAKSNVQGRAAKSANGSQPSNRDGGGTGLSPTGVQTKPCKFWSSYGNCNKGDRCSFQHDPADAGNSKRDKFNKFNKKKK